MSSMSGSFGYGNKIPSGYKGAQLQNFVPQQMQQFGDMFSHVNPQSTTARLAGGDQSAFDQLEAPALRQFGELQGDIASRFSGMGMGGRRGSGFKNTMNSAASNFAQDLQSQRMGLQQQALRDLMNMSNSLLQQKPYENMLVQKQRRPSFMQNMIGGVAPLAGAAIGGMTGGPMGAAMGGNLGSQFGAAFSGGQPQQSDWSQLANLPRAWSSNNIGGTGSGSLSGAMGYGG